MEVNHCNILKFVTFFRSLIGQFFICVSGASHSINPALVSHLPKTCLIWRNLEALQFKYSLTFLKTKKLDTNLHLHKKRHKFTLNREINMHSNPTTEALQLQRSHYSYKRLLIHDERIYRVELLDVGDACKEKFHG